MRRFAWFDIISKILKSEKHQWRRDTFSKVPGLSLLLKQK